MIFFRKPVPTFRDHALDRSISRSRRRRTWRCSIPSTGRAQAQGLNIAGLKYRTRAPIGGESVDDKLLLVEAAEAEDCELIADVRSCVPRLGGGPRL